MPPDASPTPSTPPLGRTVALTSVTMVAFAANSVLCRLALKDASIDPASYTSVRILSGAVALVAILFLTHRDRSVFREPIPWRSAATLTMYAVTFSFAYVRLNAATGALILFGTVQLTMVAAALFSRNKPGPFELGGMAIALAGLVYLELPGLEAPSPFGSALMAVAGVGWGIYSLFGRGSTHPIADTAANFVYTTPITFAVSLCALGQFEITAEGAFYAILSGGVTSGCGYVLWYTSLRGLTQTQAAAVQLTVPVLVGLGGVVLLSEELTFRLGLASALILGGIAIAIAGRSRPVRLEQQTTNVEP